MNYRFKASSFYCGFYVRGVNYLQKEKSFGDVCLLLPSRSYSVEVHGTSLTVSTDQTSKSESQEVNEKHQ